MMAAMGSHMFAIEKGTINYLLFNNAITYQILHAIVVLGICTIKKNNFWLKSAIYSFLLGILFFSGGIYLLVLHGKTAWSWITPVGGSLLILAWLNLSIFAFTGLLKSNKE